MSNQQYEALYKGKRHYDKNGKPLGGIKVMVDDSYMVEVEGGEYKICNDAYNSDEVLSFNSKTNKEILDYIHGNFSCKFEQSKAKSGDFILCRLVVNDEKKKKYSGTVRQILDAMQSEHSCRVSFGDKSMKKGGEISPEEIEERWNKKKEHIEKLSEAIRSLRNNLTRDIKGDDEKERLTALAISVIDKTAERVGNGDSEQNGHFGVTGFQKNHIKVDGNTVYLNYVGKSGVKHEKQFSDELISAALKNAMNESSCNFVFCTKDGFRIKPDKINRYLSDYGITAKDIRGYSANRWIVDRLNNIEEKDIPETEAKRKRKFNKILKSVAAKVGHGSGTLKKHYMIPELETTFIQGGEILNLSSFYSKGGYVRLSKTPAPKSERIYGSSKNAPKSAASKDSGKNIELSSSIVSSILNKLKEHNSIHKDKRVTIGVAKAVVRRGMGAYSATHRPTIKGGQPNSRVAWGLARLNAFLIKAATGKSKSGRYSQDNDLLDELNIPHEKYENGGNFKRQVVGNIIYSKNQGFLFLQRADDCEKNSGKWHILSGGVEDGESLEVAAKREFVEEVGYNGEIEIEKLQTIDFKDYEFTYFLIMPKKPFNPKLDFENKDYKWVYSIDEMLNTDLIPELKEYLISFNKGFNKIYKEGGSVDKNCIDFIKKTEAILKNGYYHRFGSFCFITYNSGNQKDLNIYQTVNLILSKSLSEILKIDEESARNLISEYCDNARRFDTLDIIKELKGCDIIIADRDKIVCANNMQNDKGGEIENLISQGVIDLKFYETTPEHAKEYGIKAIKPIFVQNLCVSEKHRLKGIGNKVLEYIESYAQNNGNDVIFGYVADNAVFSKDSRQSYFCDADMVKNWLQSKGYAINDDNNDFHKAIKDGTNTTFDANLIAPNGKPSNLTPEQWHLVRTPEFKAWFGDWENEPENASKVVDENGEPIICYHGSEKKFNVFDVNKISSKTTTDVAKLGFWFTTELWEAEGFAYGFDESERVEGVGKVYQCFLNIKKPLKINLIQKELKKTYNPNYDIAGMYVEENQNEIKKIFNNSKKFDGYNLDNIWLSINSNQIKLADGSNTTFDGSNPDIRFDNGGLIDFSEKEIRKYAENILKDFDYVYSGYSDTNGHSMYFKIDDVKIRFSDHSVTNIYRINNEVLFNLWDGKKIGTTYGDFAINQSILKLKYALGDKSIIYHKRPMMMPSGKMVNAFGYSDNSDIHFDNGGSVLLAPNGKPSNLTPEQYKLVRTPEFKAWFGDWENAPETASKVVDENGEPLVVLHGSRNDFNSFDESRIKYVGNNGDGFYFTPDKEQASKYGDNLREFFLNIRHPLLTNTLSLTENDYRKILDFIWKDEEYAQDLKNYGYFNDKDYIKFRNEKAKEFSKKNDYVSLFDITTTSTGSIRYLSKALKETTNKYFDGVISSGFREWVAFEPEQIKLADGSNTTFDGNNPDIRYEKGGNVEKEKKEIYQKWKKLVNMTAAELEKFYNSEEGKDAGLKPKEAKDLGIHYGRESARWIIKMKKTPITEWTPEMWEWAKRQINFNTRMLGNKGGLYDEKGEKTRKHTSLLIWGHNPEKKEEGGIIYSVEEMIMSLNKSPFLKVSQMPNGKISFSEIENGTDAIVEFIDSEDLKSRYLLYSF